MSRISSTVYRKLYVVKMTHLCQELHAHLSGSISRTFLKNEVTAHQDIHNIHSCFDNCLREGDLKGCFDFFRTTHNLIQTPEILESATTSVVEEFHQDNVIYLELRTTLRPLPTHRSYLNAVIKGIQNAPSVIDGKMCVTLLLSIDRSKSVDDALITLNLAKENLSNGLISGLDVSGNPQVGNLCDFIPILNAAHLYGLKTTVHIAEIADQSEDWLRFLKNHLPDRLGHGTFLTNSDVNATAAKEVVLNSHIPLELCLTSNIKSKTVETYESHHINYWMNREHPVCICTDDKGLFECTLSGEYQLAVERCGLSQQQVFKILDNSVDMTFCSENTKSQLSSKIKEYSNSFLSDCQEYN